MNIVLIGYRGTGKSTIAALVAQKLGWPVASTDAHIVTRAQRTIPEIVDTYGWEYFRDLESEVCETLANRDDVVIDTGGGAILRETNVKRLKAHGVVFWLTAPVEVIIQRIGTDTQRPSLTGRKTFTEEVAEVLQERMPLYAAAADHVLETDQHSPEHLADRIISLANVTAPPNQ